MVSLVSLTGRVQQADQAQQHASWRPRPLTWRRPAPLRPRAARSSMYAFTAALAPTLASRAAMICMTRYNVIATEELLLQADWEASV